MSCDFAAPVTREGRLLEKAGKKAMYVTWQWDTSKTVPFNNMQAKKYTKWTCGIGQGRSGSSQNVDNVSRLQFAAFEKVQQNTDQLRKELASL